MYRLEDFVRPVWDFFRERYAKPHRPYPQVPEKLWLHGVERLPLDTDVGEALPHCVDVRRPMYGDYSC